MTAPATIPDTAAKVGCAPTPGSAVWECRFKLGDKVVLKFDRKRPNCRIVREAAGPGDQAGVQWGGEKEWWNKCSVFECEMESAPSTSSEHAFTCKKCGCHSVDWNNNVYRCHSCQEPHGKQNAELSDSRPL